MDIQWEEPPASRRGANRPVITEELIAELAANPGRWARIGDFSVALSTQWKHKFPELEIVTRTAPNSPQGKPRRTIYVRWPEQS